MLVGGWVSLVPFCCTVNQLKFLTHKNWASELLYLQKAPMYSQKIDKVLLKTPVK